MKIQFPPAVVKIGIVFLLINLAIGWATGTNSGYLWVSRIYAGKPGWKFKAHDGVELSDNMLPREFQHQAGIAGFFFSGTNIVACVRRETVETYPVDLGVDYKFDKALIFLGSAGSCFFKVIIPTEIGVIGTYILWVFARMRIKQGGKP